MNNLTIKELRKLSGMSQAQFAAYLHIPLRSIQNWESSKTSSNRECKDYIIELIEYKLTTQGIIDKVYLEEYKHR